MNTFRIICECNSRCILGFEVDIDKYFECNNFDVFHISPNCESPPSDDDITLFVRSDGMRIVCYAEDYSDELKNEIERIMNE